MSDPGHATTTVHHDGEAYEIDTAIAVLVLALWRAGVGSTYSCQDRANRGRAWIRMSSTSANGLIALVGTGLLTMERTGGFQDVYFALDDVPELIERLRAGGDA